MDNMSRDLTIDHDIFTVNPLFNPFRYIYGNDGFGNRGGYKNEMNKCICYDNMLKLTYYKDDEEISTCAGIL